MKKIYYQRPLIEIVAINNEMGFAFSSEIYDWDDDSTDHGGDAE